MTCFLNFWGPGIAKFQRFILLPRKRARQLTEFVDADVRIPASVTK